jgi:hypothetical protein
MKAVAALLDVAVLLHHVPEDDVPIHAPPPVVALILVGAVALLDLRLAVQTLVLDLGHPIESVQAEERNVLLKTEGLDPKRLNVVVHPLLLLVLVMKPGKGQNIHPETDLQEIDHRET